jgi:hypothetical protein
MGSQESGILSYKSRIAAILVHAYHIHFHNCCQSHQSYRSGIVNFQVPLILGYHKDHIYRRLS